MAKNVRHIPQLEGLKYWDIKVFSNKGIVQRFREAHANGIAMVMPIRLKLESWPDWWTLPVEPLLSLKGRNQVAVRNVAKGKARGSIKELWTQDDYTITIQGVLQNIDDENAFPEAALSLLREVCEAREAVQIDCDMLRFFDIYRVVIEDYDFPFTSGEHLQNYTLKCISDDITDLLAEEEQL